MEITNEHIAVDIDKLPSPDDLQQLYTKAQPLHLEVGSGKGTFLLQQAKLHPDWNFLGIEWANKYYRYSVDRMGRWQMTNVRILRADAREFIAKYIQDESLAGFHIYFPDPWPKNRHHKRRFFAVENLAQVHRCLIPGGQFRTATDHAAYFDIMQFLMLGQANSQLAKDYTPEQLKRMEQIRRCFEPIEFYPADSADPGEWVGSNFERKYVKEGRPIYTLAMKKKT